MKEIIKKIYIYSPFFLKKIFANGEAIRRNFYRRSGNYHKYYKDINISQLLNTYNPLEQIKNLNNLLIYVKNNIPFYKEKLDFDCINSKQIHKIPLTNKKLIKNNNINNFINEKMTKKFWKGRTSGSTGFPFSYYRDKQSMQYEYALYDRLIEFFADSNNCVKARISGVNITKADCMKPPFWYYIKVFNQLQCSAYHINENTFQYYVEAFKKYNVKIGTGYAKAWLFLAQYILDNSIKTPKLKAIVTDSEGLTNEEKLKVEKAFNCPVYQTYGLSEVGMLAIQCKNNHYHIFTDRCYIEAVNENGIQVKDGEIGEIVVTDLFSFNAPFIRYRTGDTGIISKKECGCGWKTPYIKELCGRVDDYVITSDGRKISRLGHIAKPAKGVLGMQLIQTKINYLEIHVLPSKNFEPESMDKVLKVAKDYLGDFNITWKIVKELEKNKAGKVRYVIRKL